jgi:hypothetical protein
MCLQRRDVLTVFHFPQAHSELFPEAVLPGHEVVVWENGFPVRGYINGIEVLYHSDFTPKKPHEGF